MKKRKKAKKQKSKSNKKQIQINKKQKQRASAKSHRKNYFIIFMISFFLTIVSLISIVLLRNNIAGFVLPAPNGQIYYDYVLSSEGTNIPVAINYITNNGKLFSFCYSISAVLVAIFSLIVGKKIFKYIFKKGIQVDLSKIIKIIEISVLILTVFAFTSKVNSDNNIDKYKINFKESGYLESTNQHQGDKSNIIGYIKQADITEELITVYKAPTIESAPHIDGDIIGEMNIFLIRNIGKISIISEMLTIIIGVLMFVLKDYQKNIENTHHK